MSKVDALRAMREARFASRTAGRPAVAAPSAPVRPDVPSTRKAAKPVDVKSAAAPAAAAVTDELCGHRNMGGRTCTREQGHSAKSHRYS